MALSILDGNQSATTLSTILSSGQHITAHTVVSLGTQAITDMRGAVSGSVVSISNLPSTQTIAGTVTVGNSVTIGSALDALNDYALNYNQAWPIVYANTHGGDPLPISGTVSLGIQQSDDTDPNIKFLPIGFAQSDGGGQLDQWTGVKQTNPLPVYFPSTYPIPAGTNRIGVVTIGAGTVTLGASTAQIGSVTASLAYSQTATTISSTAVTAIPVVFPTSGVYGGSLQGYNGTNTYIYSGIQSIGNTSLASATSLPVSLGSLPALAAGTAQIGAVTASISGTVPISISSVTIGSCVTHGVTIANTVVTFYPAQGTTVSNTNFTSITSSTSLVAADSGREVLTVFNEGPTLYISAGATCTTISYQVRLSAGDYWECPQGQLTLAHAAVFATAGTARVTQVS